MFSLKSLLDKVTSVQSDLSDKLSTSPRWERETPDFPEDVDLSTGTELLNKYQQLWEQIHHMSMTQAEGGSAAAATITQLHSWLGRQDALMTQLTTGIAELPLLTETVEKCTGIVRETGLNISSLLVELEKLEDDCDRLHVERMKAVHHHHLDSYREERHRELLQKKAVMERTYQDSVRVRAIKECLVLKERHKTFKDEFDRDMENYKSTGNFSVRDAQTAPLDTVKSLQTAPLDTLENFVPEDDSDLSSFLGPGRKVSVLSSRSEDEEDSADQISVDQISVDQISVDQISVDQISVDHISVDSDEKS